MRGLLLRLSALDAAAENAVRVIRFFDELMARRVDLETLTRETSKLAECPVGVAEDESQVPPGSTVRRLHGGNLVWLARPGDALPLDEILVERFALTAAVLLEHASVPSTGLGNAALVELALSAGAGEADRSRALRLLGIRPTATVTVLALRATPEQAKGVADTLGGHISELGRLHAVITSQPVTDLHGPVPAGVAPPGPGIEAPTAWRRARTALMFVRQEHRHAVRWGELGALAVLAERARPQDISEVPDIAALDRITAEPGGTETLEALTAFCDTGSVRKAAALIHRHHSTLAVRLEHAEKQLGFVIATPAGKRRLDLALLLRRLRESAEV
ncbi:helix-turn-helix domain-containing protein [Streptomyces muensis]|uniref:Helix-turn-helix domain-containing protein n=1 Tax=Streptomyces muensis TaxID=1077944 RepID=A0A9X1TIT6_STRM4|nr:helix-turn-helix domain-containing protein [Streptomyces muensis]MCF1592285.1 helix-turn-helix domain-containing protein [Streptomyces muensis]